MTYPPKCLALKCGFSVSGMGLCFSLACVGSISWSMHHSAWLLATPLSFQCSWFAHLFSNYAIAQVICAATQWHNRKPGNEADLVLRHMSVTYLLSELGKQLPIAAPQFVLLWSGTKSTPWIINQWDKVCEDLLHIDSSLGTLVTSVSNKQPLPAECSQSRERDTSVKRKTPTITRW